MVTVTEIKLKLMYNATYYIPYKIHYIHTAIKLMYYAGTNKNYYEKREGGEKNNNNNTEQTTCKKEICNLP